jgi:deoxyribodipyrimidine photo-lyase
MKYDKGLFIFRRDLRIYDNTTLIKASDMCKEIICCFIFTPAQVTSENKYKSENAVQFMIETLNDLNHELKKHDCELQTFFGTNTEVLNLIFKQNKIDGCFFTPLKI